MKQVVVDTSWVPKGWSIGRGKFKFANGRPCAQCGRAADVELGGNGKAGSGVRACGACRKNKKEA